MKQTVQPTKYLKPLLSKLRTTNAALVQRSLQVRDLKGNIVLYRSRNYKSAYDSSTEQLMKSSTSHSGN